MKDSRKFQMHWNNYRYRVEDDSIVIEITVGRNWMSVSRQRIEGLPGKEDCTGGIQHPRVQ